MCNHCVNLHRKPNVHWDVHWNVHWRTLERTLCTLEKHIPFSLPRHAACKRSECERVRTDATSQNASGLARTPARKACARPVYDQARTNAASAI